MSTKIIIPITATTGPSGLLYDLVDNLTNQNSAVQKVRVGTNLEISDEGVPPEQELVIDEVNILAILAEGGEIEGNLFGIRQPSASASIDVPVGVPSRTFILGEVKTFARWYASNADVWLNNVTDEIIYYNSPNPSDSLILKASEADIIRQIDTLNYSFLTVAEVQEIVNPEGVPDPNWVKL